MSDLERFIPQIPFDIGAREFQRRASLAVNAILKDEGRAPRWVDLNQPTATIALSGGGSDPTRGADGSLLFPPAADKYVYTLFQLPWGFSPGLVYPHVVWTAESAPTDFGALWHLEYRVLTVGGGYDALASLTMASVTSGSTGAGRDNATLSLSGAAAGSYISCRFARLGASDSMSTTAAAVVVGLSVQIDARGGQDLWTKYVEE